MNDNVLNMQEKPGFHDALISYMRDIVAVLDEAMVIRYINEASEEHLGWRPSEMIGRPAGDFIHPEDLAEFAHRFHRISAGSQKRLPIVLRILTAAGNYEFWEILGRDGRSLPELNGFVIVGRSVQDRQNFELELRVAEQRQRALLQAFPDWIGRINEDGLVLDIHAPNELFTGFDPHQFKGQLLADFLPAPQAVLVKHLVSQVLATKSIITTEIALSFPYSDIERLMEVRASPSGPGETLILAREVTQQRATQKQLERQNDLLRTLHEMSLDLLERLDLDDVLTTIVQRARQLLDTERGVLFLVNEDENSATLKVGQGVFTANREIVIKPGDGVVGTAWQRAEIFVVNNYPEFEHRLRTIQGSIPAAVVGVPLWSGGRVRGLLALGRTEPQNPFVQVEVELLRQYAQLAAIALDNALLYEAATVEIKERQNAESDLRQRDTLLQAVRYAAETFLSSASWQVSLPAVLEQLGFAAEVDFAGVYRHIDDPDPASCYQEEAIWYRPNVPIPKTAKDADFSAWQALLEDHQIVSVIAEELPEPYRGYLLANSIYTMILAPIFVNHSWWGVVGFGMVTHTRHWGSAIEDALQAAAGTLGIAIRRQKSDALMRRTQKLESLGLLAGGIAHDFNNLLTGVLGQTSIVGAKLPAEHPAQKNVEKAIRSTRNASELVRQMLAYAGKEEFIIQPLDLNKLIESNAGLLDTVMPTASELNIRLAADLPPIMGDKGQIQQVVMNLAINAAQALPNGDGTVTISTSSVDWLAIPSAQQAEELADLPAGKYVCLAITDSGIGMDAITQAKVFDPFFSTKADGHGLGLSATQGIIQNHGGRIWIDSQLGVGTEFRVVLPASEELPDTQTITPMPKPVTNGVVLVIDDEYHIREVASDILSLAGIQVVTAEDGIAGLRYFERTPDHVDLVILDMMMPKLDGEQTYLRLRALDPEVKVVLSTGYSDLETKERLVGLGIQGFLKKPYDTQELLEIVQMALATTSPASTIGPARS